MMAYKGNDDYIDVAARIAEAREIYPDGRLRPADPAKPYAIEILDGATYIVVVAAFFRSPEDTLPGIGMAYEIFPGKTNFTRGSELQNAETSAWGRAMVAALVADTKRGIASANEVRNRQAEQARPEPKAEPKARSDADLARDRLRRVCQATGTDLASVVLRFKATYGEDLKTSQNAVYIDALADEIESPAEVPA